MKKMLLACLTAVIATAVVQAAPAEQRAAAGQPRAANLLTGGDGEEPDISLQPARAVRRNTNEAKSGKASLEMDGPGTVVFPGLIEIDRSRTYELSGQFKSVRPGQPSRVLLDLRLFTADKRRINSWAVKPVTGVSTVSSGAKAGERKLRVARTNWPEDVRKFRLALDAREDLSDLPNFDTHNIASFVTGETDYEITLAEPLAREVPVGTTVRLHRYQDHPRVWNNHVPYEWTRYCFSIADKSVSGAGAKHDLWPGARYAEVRIMHHYNRFPEPLPPGELPPILLFDDITLIIRGEPDGAGNPRREKSVDISLPIR